MYYLRKKPMCRIHWSYEKWQNTHPWTFIVQPVIPKEMAIVVLPVFQATGSMREPWGKWAGWCLAAVQKWRRKKSCLFLTCAMVVSTYSYHITVSLTPPILYSDIGSRHEIQLCESPLQKVVILIRTKFWTYINEGQKTELQGSVFNHSSTYWKVCYVPYILQEERINKTPWKNSYPVGINEVSVPRAGDIPENKIRHLSRSLYYINLSPVRAILISMWASV